MSGSTPERPRVRGRWAAFVEPRPDGLPNWRVITLPLVILAAIFLGLVAFGVTGTSTGVVHAQISTGSDPDLIAGNPEGIRSDEWFVQTTWTISQVQQSLPLRNESFPGGMDATVQHDLPTRDWSTAFRPHLVGFLFLPLDQAMAVKWWFPSFAMMAATFLFAVVLMPRRPLSALGLGVAFFFSPFFQWWFLSITFYPPAWAMLVMATITWCLRARRRVGAWVLGALVAYLTVALGTGIYAPFIVPVVLIALAYGLGAVLMKDPQGAPIMRRIRRVLPVLIAGAVGGTVLVVWLVTRWSTIVGFTSTVYPGQRLQAVGHAGLNGFGGLFSGFLSSILATTFPFDGNSSEASTFLMPGVFTGVVLVWLVVERIRAKAGIDWLVICVIAAGAVLLAFLFLPGWDLVAHLLFIDRATYGRARIGFGVLSVVMIVLVAVRLRERKAWSGGRRLPSWVPLTSAAMAALSIGIVIWLAVRRVDVATVLGTTSKWLVLLCAVIALLYILDVWLLARGSVAWGVAILLVISIVASGWVNPIYHGVLDLRSTKTVREVMQLNRSQPGTWVGINTSPVPTMMLVESGVSALNGFQSTPSRAMWHQIDPRGQNERIWNRLANVSWVARSGAPAPRNPAPDQIQMTFDSCDAFAQQHVTWVLAEGTVSQQCLRPVNSVQQGPTQMNIYKVVPAG
jgi:hypothetical protein